MDDIFRIRKRPGMYAGDVQDGTALHNLAFGLVGFAVSQAQSHSSYHVDVILRADLAMTVTFMSMEACSKSDLALFAEARLDAATSVDDCIRLAPDALDITQGCCCDLCVVNALSDWMCDQMWSDSSIHAHMFRDAALESRIGTAIIPDAITFGAFGASTTFLPSTAIFPSIRFDVDRLHDAFDRIERRCPGVRVTLLDHR